jgi:GNAT superfamily N-acetyltransferase
VNEGLSNQQLQSAFFDNEFGDPCLAIQPDGSIRFRALTRADQPALWHWLHIALWDPPPAPVRPLEVLQHPGVSIYAEGWGRTSDVGVVAVVAGEDAGACWMRLLPLQVGLAYVDEATPQLGIALEPQFQRQGYGKPLMLRALGAAAAAGYQQVALTVHPENGARFMYQQCGFEFVALRGSYHLMVAKLA